MTTKKFIPFILLMCAFLLIFTACQSDISNNSSEDTSSTSIPNTSTSDASVPTESNESRGFYARTNFVKRMVSADGSESYAPILDDIIYDGGELEIYVEFEIHRTPSDVRNFSATALFFVDGYMQEFSLDNDEKALMHNITVQNDETGHVNYRFTPVVCDDNAKEHYISAVILINDRVHLPEYNFTKEAEPIGITRKITLNTINKPEKNNVIKMDNREKTAWDNSHSEQPYKRGNSDSELTFHYIKQGEACCYIFCDGKLFSQDGKYIFEGNNDNADTVSFANISVSELDIGKALYVLYVPKDDSSIQTTANYLWGKSN